MTQTDAFASIAVDPVARRDMNVAKVLTRLAVSICSHPTMQQGRAPDRVTQLTELLESSKAVADRLLSSVAPADGHRGWLKANALEAAALMLAEQYRADVHGEIQPIAIQIEVLEAVFARARLDDSVDAVLQDLDEARYEAATTSEVAQARVRLSMALAAWDLHSHVTSTRLGAGNYRFTYGLGPDQIVEPLLKQALSMAIDFDLASPNLDVRTAHRQSCIRRAADLLGSRYVERTRQVMDWIAAPDTSLQEYRQRHAKACAMLRASILPEVINSAHEDFRAIWEVVERTQFASRSQVDRDIHSPNRSQHQEDDGHERREYGSSPRQA